MMRGMLAVAVTTAALTCGCAFSGMNYGDHVVGGLQAITQTMYWNEAFYLTEAAEGRKVSGVAFGKNGHDVIANLRYFLDGTSVFAIGQPLKDADIVLAGRIVYEGNFKQQFSRKARVRHESALERRIRWAGEDRRRRGGMIEGIYVDMRPGKNFGKRFIPKPSEVYWQGRDFLVVAGKIMGKRGLMLEAFDDAHASRTRYSHALSAPWAGSRAVYAYTGEEGQIITALVMGLPEGIDAQVNSLLEAGTNCIEGICDALAASGGQAALNDGTASAADAALDLIRRNAPLIGSDKWAVYSIQTPRGDLRYIPCVAYLGARTRGKVGSPDGKYFWVFREDKVARAAKVIWHIGSDTLSILALSGHFCSDGGTEMAVAPTAAPGPQ